MREWILAGLTAFSLLGAPLSAIADSETRPHAEASSGDIHVSEAWARAMLPGQPTGGAYLTIRNSGGEPDTLVSVKSPAAQKVEVHSMKMQDDVMVMRPVEGGLEIPAGETVTLEPGGLHLMFMQVEEPLSNSGTVPVTLDFENAGTVSLEVPVLPASTGRGTGGHDH